GVSVLCLDEKHVQDLIPYIEKRYITYGLSGQADVRAINITYNRANTSFEAVYRNNNLGQFRLGVPGLHNVYNALAAIAVALDLEISLTEIKNALLEFRGVNRRFQLKAEVNDIMIFDDYGHHPTEIKATLSASKAGWNRRTIVIFQPHRYTRTKFLLKEFATAFYQSDILVVTDIYPAGEEPIEGVSALQVAEEVKGHGHKNVMYISNREELINQVLEILRPQDILLTLGAGDVWKIGEHILHAIERK
ncbi:MAG: cyanophycin synthetase, partial [bacterium]